MSNIRNTDSEQSLFDGLTSDVLPKSKTTKPTAPKGSNKSRKKTPLVPEKALPMQPGGYPTYYLPVSQLRAQVFLAHGIIYPARYDIGSARPINDAQSRVPDALELWTEQPPISKGELLLGVRLSSEELTSAVRAEDAILLVKPLPISRLVEIVVPAKSSEEVTKYVRGWIVSDVPVPEALFTSARVIDDAHPVVEPTMSITPGLPAVDSSRIHKAIANYDRIMGMFAFMRNSARYHSARLGLYADSPAQFFRLAGLLYSNLDLSHIPDVKPSPLLQALLMNNPSEYQIINHLYELISSDDVYIDKAKAKPVANAILEVCGKDANIREAFSNLFDEDYKAAIRLLQKELITENALLLAALYKFSNRQSNDHRNIKHTIHEDWVTVPPVATMLGMMGAYYGYTALDARESRLYSVDHRLTEYIDQQPPIKFHLESLFERELIEAIYQWTFNDLKFDSNMAALFENLNKQTSLQMPPSSLWKDDTYIVRDFRVRNIKLTTLARLLRRIEELPCSHIDETTPLGQYLMPSCFFQAEEYELSCKQGQNIFRYRISKQRLAKLFEDGKLQANMQVLQAAIDETAAGRK